MTRLSNAISQNDAHAIDLKYHKLCWTQHVFHVLRDHATNNAKSTMADLPMQMSCLIKLINISQSKAYIPMDQIEATHISMLMGSEEAQKHNPTLTSQWLKDKILQELPSVKSVRQKDRRKPSVLCYPEACEEDMVHTSMMQSYESEMSNSKMLYKTAKLICRSIVDFTDEKKKSDIVILEVSYSSAIVLSVFAIYALFSVCSSKRSINSIKHDICIGRSTIVDLALSFA